jgi:hypothetical protein
MVVTDFNRTEIMSESNGKTVKFQTGIPRQSLRARAIAKKICCRSGPAIDESQTLCDRPRCPYDDWHRDPPITDRQEATANTAGSL